MTSQVSSQVVTSLSEAWKTAVQQLFEEENNLKRKWLVVTYYGEPLTSETLIRDLRPNRWISDDVLNGYAQILKEAFNQCPIRQFAVFNMQFLPQFDAKCEHIGWQKFTDGTDKSNLESFHLIFVSVH
jgi:hypothetical protein